MEDISEILEKFDFKVIDFQDMSIKDQVILVNKSDILGGIHGAGLTNMLFLEKDKRLSKLGGLEIRIIIASFL